MNVVREFQRRGPWVTRFNVAGKAVGGAYHAASDRRLEQFFDRFPHPRQVLELGCLEGGHSVEIARRAERVIAIDSRPENIERARFVASFFDVSNIDFIVADLETFDLAAVGPVDVVFNVGLLYHLPEPWLLLERIARQSPSMFLWTHVAGDKGSLVEQGGYRGEMYREGGKADPLSGMSDTSFWPTLGELERMLISVGFDQIEIIEKDDAHPHGPAVTLACHRSTAASNNVSTPLPFIAQ